MSAIELVQPKLNIKQIKTPEIIRVNLFDFKRDVSKEILTDIKSHAMQLLNTDRRKELMSDKDELTPEVISALVFTFDSNNFLSWTDQERISRTVKKESENFSKRFNFFNENTNKFLHAMLCYKLAWPDMFSMPLGREIENLREIKNKVNSNNRIDDNYIEKLALLKLIKVKNLNIPDYSDMENDLIIYGLGLKEFLTKNNMHNKALKILFNMKIISPTWYEKVINSGKITYDNLRPDRFINNENKPFLNAINIMYFKFLNAEKINIGNEKIELIQPENNEIFPKIEKLPIERNFI